MSITAQATRAASIVRLFDCGPAVTALSYHPNGQWLAAGDGNGTVQVFDATNWMARGKR
jgi:WD40 repeat protein